MGLSKELPPEKLLQVALQALRRGEPVALATIVRKEGSGPRSEGSKILVLRDGSVYGTLGGGFFESHVVETALQALKEGKPLRKRYSFVGKPVKDAVDTGLICGGVLEVFVDVLRPSPRAVVFGVGRVGKPLADLLNFLGFRVVVMDPSEGLVREDLFPYAEGRYSGKLDELESKLKEIVREDDFVIVTHGEPESDYRITKAALRAGVKYVGLLGSKRKVAEFIKRLLSDGFNPEEIASRLRAPVGAEIPAETPEEISVSIAAELISIRRGGEVKTLNIVPELVRRSAR